MPAVPTTRARMTVGLLLCVLAVAFENMAVLTAMPAAAADLGDRELYAWAFTAIMLPQLVAIAVAGRWCDTRGPLRPFAVGLALCIVGIVVAAESAAMGVLLVGRAVQGFGGGFVNLTLMVTTGRLYAPAERARVMTWFSACWMLPSFLGPAAAAWLVEHLTWHWVFWAVLPFFVVGATFVLPGLRGLDAPEADAAADHVPVLAALAVALGATLIQAAGQTLAWTSVPLALAGGALLAGWLRRLMPRGFSPAGPGMSSTVVTRLVMAGSFFGLQAFLPLMLVERGASYGDTGLAIAVSSAGWMLGSWVQSQRWLTLSRDRIIALGAACVAAGLGVAGLGAWLPAVGMGLPVAGFTVAGLGMGLATASTSLVVMQLSQPAELGRNTSSLQTGEMLGNALLAGLAGTLFASLSPLRRPEVAYGAIGVAMTVTAVVGVLVALRIGHVENASARR